MADPFKKAVGRVMRTDLKSDEAGPYYDVQVSGGGGVAPVSRGQDASPTVLDPERDYGPPLPPGSTDERDDDGPEWAGTAGDEPDDLEEDDGAPPEPADPVMSRAAFEAARAARAAQFSAGEVPADQGANFGSGYLDFVAKRLQALGLDPAQAATLDYAAAFGLAPPLAAALKQEMSGGFGASPDEEVWGDATDEDEVIPGRR